MASRTKNDMRDHENERSQHDRPRDRDQCFGPGPGAEQIVSPPNGEQQQYHGNCAARRLNSARRAVSFAPEVADDG